MALFLLEQVPYVVVFLFGLAVGSFVNVCIFRLPAGESVAKGRSRCMSCHAKLLWRDMIPVVSYICLRGRCRNCKAKIAIQYPVIETVNGLLYVFLFKREGFSPDSLVDCLAVSALLALSVIDWRTFEIPFVLNGFLFFLGAIRLMLHLDVWPKWVLGFFAVSFPLYVLFFATGGTAIGGGDVKLMAACGFLFGWQKVLLAFAAGCMIGSVIHVIRMKTGRAGKVLAMGPYLSAGMFLSMCWGEKWLEWWCAW